MMGNQCFAIDFKHDTGIMHMDPRHGPISDKSDPQFAGYGPVIRYYVSNAYIFPTKRGLQQL